MEPHHHLRLGLLLCLLLSGVSDGFFKQWTPNTNFETGSNWDRNQTPCAGATARFEAQEEVSVYVRQTHWLADVYLPLDAEFILAPSAGFGAFDGDFDPSCDPGPVTRFLGAGRHSWLDPTLWLSASSLDDLRQGPHLFSVDEERIPCRHDDVIFPAETSFRVDVGSAGRTIEVRSVSILGQKFTQEEDLSRYLGTSSGRLQFWGGGSLRVDPTPCSDPSGCLCGNAELRPKICAALLQSSAEGACPQLSCQLPLMPVGQCCEMCGAVLTLDYTADFDLERYRARIFHTFLNLPQHAGVQMAISKVQRPPATPEPRGHQPEAEIQIVLADALAGAEAGRAAERLGQDLLRDITQHGGAFGIVSRHTQTSSGSQTAEGSGARPAAGLVAGISAGLLLGLLLVGGSLLLLLQRKGLIRIPSLPAPMAWGRRASTLAETVAKDFDNPMFDTPPLAESELDPVPQKPQGARESGCYFVNPVFDVTELEV
ncbi:protein amnionless isoform X1 [Tachyglossus aculeatus]|uniref:protein amnionless isoform X1 n=1 Tax=Tachyglossus aculeatus TaxID=9261 RepID=UPI0018F514F6|nr:protein amnionless isoform X1 [Tachyglossus aculeatus]